MRNKTEMIHPDNLHPNKYNPRHEAGDVTALARSMSNEEQLLPLLVIPSEEHGYGHYWIEDGYRRWVAAKKDSRLLECIIRFPAPGESLAARALVTGLITDVHKVNLNAMERAWAYGRMAKELGMDQGQIGARVGLHATTISRYMALLELADKHQQEVFEGKLKVEDAIRIVERHRAQVRKKAGKPAVGAVWEPDHFTDKHHLARRARKICDAREHTARRRLGNIACGQCWEEAIRQDQTTVLQAAYIDSQRDEQNPVFMPPFATADGAARPGVVANGLG